MSVFIDINDMEDYRENSYLNYRIALKAKFKRKLGGIQNGSPENKDSESYKLFADEAEKEIGLLGSLGIKPVKTNMLIGGCGKEPIPGALPQYLHIYDPLNIFTRIKPLRGLFLTSSRYKNAQIYIPAKETLKDFELFRSVGNFDFICIGTGSEAEINFIRNFSGDFPLIILPAYSLINDDFINRFMQNVLNYENSLLISALDPFSENSKYAFAIRNNLAFNMSVALALLYLSKKSSLFSIIKKFEKTGKPVKIFEGDYQEHIEPLHRKYRAGYTGIKKEHDSIQQFIINCLEKENIALDNLLKLSNIKLNTSEKEIAKAISMLEINCEIERCPGGIIKKL
jgi:hypothetical protein